MASLLERAKQRSGPAHFCAIARCFQMHMIIGRPLAKILLKVWLSWRTTAFVFLRSTSDEVQKMPQLKCWHQSCCKTHPIPKASQILLEVYYFVQRKVFPHSRRTTHRHYSLHWDICSRIRYKPWEHFPPLQAYNYRDTFSCNVARWFQGMFH